MNLRFKFRVWSVVGKRMINTWDVSSLPGYLYGALVDQGFFQSLLFRGQYITMQSTGLKDKHGKLIYEGDIIKYTSMPSKSNPEKEPFTENYKVAWDETYLSWNTQRYNGVNCHNLGLIKNQIEVIGNIYENPELLEVNNENT